jgi:hypothetical protein
VRKFCSEVLWWGFPIWGSVFFFAFLFPQHCTEFDSFFLFFNFFSIRFIQPPNETLTRQVPGARVHEGTMTPYTLPDGQQKYLYKKTRIHFASLPWTDTPFPDPILPTEPPSLSLPS